MGFGFACCRPEVIVKGPKQTGGHRGRSLTDLQRQRPQKRQPTSQLARRRASCGGGRLHLFNLSCSEMIRGLPGEARFTPFSEERRRECVTGRAPTATGGVFKASSHRRTVWPRLAWGETPFVRAAQERIIVNSILNLLRAFRE